MHDVLARLQSGAGDERGVIGRHAVVEAALGNDADQDIVIEIDGVGVRTGPLA